MTLTPLFVWLSARLDLRDEKGQTAVEYALVIALVSIIIVGLLASGATSTFDSFWSSVKAKLTF
ncbi:MAG: Flp/Fap pilin component [Solirubrobacteraceae bacterium]|jgi:Flp pilus assembly pilin Flp|nr:Flp/Fap pilin component [Solirubrobacteraceae bacterium]